MTHQSKRLTTRLILFPLALLSNVLISGLTGTSPMCVHTTRALGLNSLATTEPPTDAPSWTLYDLKASSISSEDVGKAYLDHFWAIWCPPCHTTIVTLIESQEDNGDQGLEVVGISLVSDGPEKVASFNCELGVNYTSLIGEEKMNAALGGGCFLPASFLIDHDGRIIERHAWLADRGTLEPAISQALGLD